MDRCIGKKSVLLIGNQASKFIGTQAVCEVLAELLRKHGWQVVIASERPARVRRLLDMLLTTWRYRYIYNAAIVEVFSGKSFIWAELVSYLLWLMKKPFILALYGGRLPDFALKQKRRVRFLFSLAEVVISPSTYLQTEMKPYRSDILLFPYGVKIEEFIFRQRISPLPCLTSLRGFHSIYNPQLAPKVLALLLSEFPNANLVMIGGDKGDGSWGKTGQLIRTLGFEDRVKMLGWVERESVPKLLNKADIFLNTPNVDNTPLSIIEAMASGLCIVSTNVGGVPYLIDDGHDALLVPPDDPDAMAAAVRRILTEPGLAERLSRNARKKAEHYDWSVILPKWESLIGTVSAGKGRERVVQLPFLRTTKQNAEIEPVEKGRESDGTFRPIV